MVPGADQQGHQQELWDRAHGGERVPEASREGRALLAAEFGYGQCPVGDAAVSTSDLAAFVGEAAAGLGQAPSGGSARG